MNINDFENEFPLLKFFLVTSNSEFNLTDGKNLVITLFKFKNKINCNPFIPSNIKNDLEHYLNGIIRTNYLQIKYLNLWKKNIIINNISVNLLDFEFNQIDQDNKSNIYYIDYENKKKYLFTQKDFKKLIENNLFNSWMYDYSPDPLEIKNPYDNSIFTKQELSLIDTQLIEPPLVWRLFKNSNYNISILKQDYNTYLLKNCLSSYISNLEDDDILYYLNDILLDSEDYCKRCLLNKSLYRTKKIKYIIYRWFWCVKFGEEFTINDLKKLCSVFNVPCEIHYKKLAKKKILNSINTFTFPNNLTCDPKLFIFSNNSILSNNKIVKKNKKNKVKIIDFNVYNRIHVELLECDGRIKVFLKENLFNTNTGIKTII